MVRCKNVATRRMGRRSQIARAPFGIRCCESIDWTAIYQSEFEVFARNQAVQGLGRTAMASIQRELAAHRH